MLPERPSAALAGLDKEVSDGSTIVSCWSESPPAEQSPGLDTCPVEALGEGYSHSYVGQDLLASRPRCCVL